MSNYTPTTELVRRDYCIEYANYYPDRAHEFDRWLASVKAEAMETGYNLGFVDGVKQSKAEAWDEGYDACLLDSRLPVRHDPVVNPYREVTE